MTERPTLTTSEAKRRIEAVDPTGELRVEINAMNGIATLSCLGLDYEMHALAYRALETMQKQYWLIEG